MELYGKDKEVFLDVLLGCRKDASLLDVYTFLMNTIRKSPDRRLAFYSHFILEYLSSIKKFKAELRKSGITIEQYYHYNQLFNEEFRHLQADIHKFLPYLPHTCKVIRPWSRKEKGILISNFIGCDKRYDFPLHNSWSENKRNFFKDNYYLFNHSCCRHIHHVEPIQDIDLLLVSDRWKKEEFAKENQNIRCIISSDAFYVKTDKFCPDPDVKKEYDIIYITRFDECKRNNLLLSALAGLKGARCLLVFADYCHDKNIERGMLSFIRKNELDVDMISNITREELISYINKSRIAVNFSIGSIDRSVFECLSMDIPLLYLTDTPCGRDIINSQTGILVDPSPDKIAEGISCLLKNLGNFSPRKWVLDNWGEGLANAKLKDAVKEFGFGSTENVSYTPGEHNGSCVGTYL